MHAQLCPTLCNPMDFFSQEYWRVLPFPTLGDLPDPGFEPISLALTDGFFTTACHLESILYSTISKPGYWISTVHSCIQISPAFFFFLFFVCFFFGFLAITDGIWVVIPNRESNLCSLYWELRALIPGPPGNSLTSCILNHLYLCLYVCFITYVRSYNYHRKTQNCSVTGCPRRAIFKSPFQDLHNPSFLCSLLLSRFIHLLRWALSFFTSYALSRKSL